MSHYKFYWKHRLNSFTVGVTAGTGTNQPPTVRGWPDVVYYIVKLYWNLGFQNHNNCLCFPISATFCESPTTITAKSDFARNTSSRNFFAFSLIVSCMIELAWWTVMCSIFLFDRNRAVLLVSKSGLFMYTLAGLFQFCFVEIQNPCDLPSSHFTKLFRSETKLRINQFTFG